MCWLPQPITKTATATLTNFVANMCVYKHSNRIAFMIANVFDLRGTAEVVLKIWIQAEPGMLAGT